MSPNYFMSDVSTGIWENKYRYRTADGSGDASLEDSWRRVAAALAETEPSDKALWRDRFFSILQDFHFLPGGRILAGAGTSHQVTLFNCFVMGEIDDSLDGIFEALKEGALTLQQGGGIGYDFSTLRPRGEPAVRVGSIASGPVSFMKIWDSMCATILSTGTRRGAMMASLRCDHPDVEDFVEAKRDPLELRHFNLSVQISDDFMQAVQSDAEWRLVFPLREGECWQGETVQRAWSGSRHTRSCRVVRRISARKLWQKILQAAYDCAEPGVIFIDRINRLNNLWYVESLSATNPCGEIPLPPYGACDLGSLNLSRYIRNPFS
ncbi:MAG: ribonucleoside-diphosphate reductase, adenosylcobalamin-dependent, partial [Sulfuricellaceae bacterium]|nr:ribonucleoside-diphosphate reductase, adenosylcobalamin-dependent [Sulfuricellaceae bacterium]